MSNERAQRIVYGIKGDELFASIENAIYELFDSVCESPADVFALADKMTWPIIVSEYRPVDATAEIHHHVSHAVEDVLESLDEDFADPYGDNYTKPTQTMIAIAAALEAAIVECYVPWACEPTDVKHEVTRDKAMEILNIEEAKEDGT